MKPWVKRLIQYSITIAVCALLTFVLSIAFGLFTDYKTLHTINLGNFSDEFTKNMYVFSSSSFVVGTLTLAIGLLIFVSNGGFFDMFVYGMWRFFTLFNFKRHPSEFKYPTFYDYKVAKAERPKSQFLFLVIVGALFIAISLIFVYFWQKYNVPVE